MSVAHAYRMLDVPEGSTPDDIKDAYRIMALKWHPDRHHNTYDRDHATLRFLEVTDAYRTLVREGHVKARRPHDIETCLAPLPVGRPQPMSPKSSSGSSVSLDSFVHMVASSAESYTPPPSSNRDSLPSSWKQGVRQPTETMASHYRNIAPPASLYSYETERRGTEGPAMYKPPPQSAHPTSRKSSIPTPSHPQPLQPKAPKSERRAQTLSAYNPRPNPPFETPNKFPPYSLPLVSVGLGPSGEWIYSLTLTLEELYGGKHCRFGITRLFLGGRSKNVVIEIDIPPGCRPGTRILCRGVGHESQPGSFQDIAFIIEEVPHDRFVRLFDDLIMDIRLPWVDSLRKQGGKVPFQGVDGRSLVIQIDYPRDKNMKGRNIVKGAGMPIREGGVVAGRGNLVVQWEILPPKTKFIHIFKRFLGFGR